MCRFGIYLGFENYHIFTWKGYEHKDYENMNPHYLDAQGAVGDARLQMMNLRGSFAISPKVGISAETAWWANILNNIRAVKCSNGTFPSISNGSL